MLKQCIAWWEVLLGSAPIDGVTGGGVADQATNLISYDLNKCWSGIRSLLCPVGGLPTVLPAEGQIGFQTPELHFHITGKCRLAKLWLIVCFDPHDTY